MKNQMCSRTVDEVNMTTDAGRVAGTVRALVRLCIAPGCAVAFRGPRETCPCCGGPSEPAKPAPPQPERGAGALCRECAHRGACPPGADLRRVTSGGEADDECCWEYQPNAGGEGREPCERTSPPPCSAPLVAQPPRDVSELYHELLYAVARKFPGESRHETALRYIRDTEERAGQAGSCKQNMQLPNNNDSQQGKEQT